MWLIIEKTDQIINMKYFIHAYEITKENYYANTGCSVGDTRLVFLDNVNMDIPVNYKAFHSIFKKQIILNTDTHQLLILT